MEDHMQPGDEESGPGKQSLLDFSKERISHQLDQASEVVRKACEGLDHEGGVGRLADRAAAMLADAGKYAAGAEPRHIVRDTNDFAHRQPEVFLGGAFLSGLLLGRFLRSRPPGHAAGKGDASGSQMGFHGQMGRDETVQHTRDGGQMHPGEGEVLLGS